MGFSKDFADTASSEIVKHGKRKAGNNHPGNKLKRLRVDNAFLAHQDLDGTEAVNSTVEECKPLENDFINPTIRKEIQSILEHRNRCTLKIHGLPAKTTMTELEKLAPEAKAFRLPWITRLYRCHGFAFLEFESAEKALMHKEKLHKTSYKGKTLFASAGKFISECIGEIARKFPSSTNISFDKTNNLNARHKPGVAYLTFASEEDAVNAIKSRQGCLLRGRKVSILFRTKQKETSKNCLLVRGLSKKVTKDDLLAVFPQASSVHINHFRGEAQLMYGLEEDCLLDQKQAKDLLIGGRNIQVFSISVNKKDAPKIVQSRSTYSEKIASSSVVVDKCSLPLSEETIHKLFPKAVDFLIPSQSSQNGVACVKFATLSQAKRAIKLSDGKSMRVRMANPKRMRLLGISERSTIEKKDEESKRLLSVKVEHNKIDEKVKRNKTKHIKSKAHFLNKRVTP
ncbi:nucleolin [Schistosoma japonicum]|uniref:Nucleolin n=1 Tax=Schistosoma japonicum TaxID=6182 RepID=A0A4Z2DAG0_SCHJA|nr:nucleolin [Schistosoma japonicum]